MNEETVKKMALVIAANCLSQEDTKASHIPAASENTPKELNKQVSDRLYTFLLYLLNKPSNEYSSLMTELAKKYPEDWPLPDLDPSFMQIVNQASHQKNGSALI